jgi:hypothetical protein
MLSSGRLVEPLIDNPKSRWPEGEIRIEVAVDCVVFFV